MKFWWCLKRRGAHGNRETNTHKHTQHKSKSVSSKSDRPKIGLAKSVMAKIGHATETPTLAKIGLTKVRLAKVGHDHHNGTTAGNENAIQTSSTDMSGLPTKIVKRQIA